MTNQEAFDRVARHLLTQGRASLGMNGSCAYRGEHGLRCAIGALIPDAAYCPDWEGSSVEDLALYREPFLAGADADLLMDLQTIHDTDYPEDWATALLGAAEAYGLRVVVPLPTYPELT